MLIQSAKAWHQSASPNLHGLARAAVLGFGQDEPRSFKSLRRLAKFRDARDFCRVHAPQRQREQHTGSERVPWGVHESLLAFLAGFYLNSEFYKTPLDNELYSFLTRSH